MRVGPIAHGALLVAALGFAYQTWTRDTSKASNAGDFKVWEHAEADFEGLSYEGENKSISVTKRGEGDDAYLWGTVKRTRKKPRKPPPRKVPTAPGLPGKPGALPGKPGAVPGKPGAKPATKPATKKPAAKPAPKTPNQNDQIPPADTKKAPAKAAPKRAPAPKPATKPATTPPAPKGAGGPSGTGPGIGGLPSGHPTPGVPAAGAPAAPLPKPPAPEPEMITTERQFPVGDAADDLIKNFSTLRAMRRLGKPSAEQLEEYGLDVETDQLTVFFKGGEQRVVKIGDRVFGGSDRYILDEKSGEAFVIAAAVMRQVDGAESSLSLRNVHKFKLKTQIDLVGVDTGSVQKSLAKLVTKDDQGKEKTRWALSDSPDDGDLMYSNFLDRVDKLKPTEYNQDLPTDTLTRVAKLTYNGKRDGVGAVVELGYVELYRQAPEPAKEGETPKKKPTAEYYIRTERTRVLGKVSRLSAERVETDLKEIFKTSLPADGGDKPTEGSKPE